jgi:hypothetical protein
MKTTSPAAANPLRSVLLIALFAILALTVLTQANPGTEIPNRDYGFYAYIGKQIVQGHLPYRDAWESKPPAIFYLNALALRLGRGLRWGIWLVEFTFLFSAIAASFYLIQKLWGTAPALFGVVTWLWGLDFTLQGGNYTEEYPLIFHFLALILLLKLIRTPEHRLFNWTLGLLLSISFLFRPNNAIVESVVILVLALSLLFQKNFRAFFISAFWIALGFIIPIAITSAYFAYHGLFQAMLESAILYNLSYSGTQLTATSPLLVGFEFLNLSAWIALLGYLLVLLRIKNYLRTPTIYLLIVLLLGMPAAVYLSDPAKRNYGHYFINWLPFIALLSGFAFYTIQEKLTGLTKNIPAMLAPLLALTASAAFFIISGRVGSYQLGLERLVNGTERELRSPVSIYVENHTAPGEYVLFWATHPGENFMSHRNTPHSTLFYPMMVDSDISDRLNADFFADIQRNKPVLIVDMGRISIPSLDPQKREEQLAIGLGLQSPPGNLQEVLKYFEDNYYLEAVIKGKSVYRLRGTSRP